MERYLKKTKTIMISIFIVSFISIIIGYILWTILIPIQDFHLMTSEEILIAQKDLALNYPLGRILLYSGFTGLGITSVCFIFYFNHKYKKMNT